MKYCHIEPDTSPCNHDRHQGIPCTEQKKYKKLICYHILPVKIEVVHIINTQLGTLHMLEKAQQQRLVKLATWASILVALFLIILKTWAWQTTASVSLMASLLDSLMDAAASIINFFAVRYAMMPADEDHRFGHGKAEALAGLAQASLIGVSVIWLFGQSADRIMNPQPSPTQTSALW